MIIIVAKRLLKRNMLDFLLLLKESYMIVSSIIMIASLLIGTLILFIKKNKIPSKKQERVFNVLIIVYICLILFHILLVILQLFFPLS